MGYNINGCFAQILITKRKTKRYSQKTLAEKANLTNTYISLLERGLRNPSLQSFIDISLALEIPLQDFLHELVVLANKQCEAATS